MSIQKAFLFLLALAIALGALVADAPEATAQPAAGQPVQLHVVPSDGPRGGAQVNPTIDPDRNLHGDRVESHGKGMALLFWLFAAASIGGALFVISRRNLIAAVMGMVGSFLGIAAVYMMLYAHFLAVVQMLVYAGAIMVLFVFVIMILNRPEDEPVAPTGHVGQLVGGIAILYLLFRLVMLLAHVHVPASAQLAPPPMQLPGGDVADWGTVKAVGSDLFSGGLFPFEAISILLLISVVGAIAIAKPLKDDDGEDADVGEDLATAASGAPHTDGGHA